MRNLLLLVLAATLLGGLFLVMRPVPPAVVEQPPAAAEATTSIAALPEPPAPAARRFELLVQGKKLLGGPAVIDVVQGETLTLVITSDHHDELHLHGYDLTLSIPAGQPAELTFVADRSGRFEFELHHAHLELGALQVHPR